MRSEPSDTPAWKLKPVDYGKKWVSDLTTNGGTSLFRTVVLDWMKPQLWLSGTSRVVNTPDQKAQYLYMITRNHGKAAQKERMHYIGVTGGLHTRFYNHPKACYLRDKGGATYISFCRPQFGGRLREGRRQAIEQLEHILMWALGPVENERKYGTLPGMGANYGRAWHIKNIGHPFAGQMPLEIVYPWMLAKWGRDVSWA